MEQIKKSIALFILGAICFQPSIFAMKTANQKVPEQKQYVKKKHHIDWEDFPEGNRLESSIPLGLTPKTRKLAQNGLKAVTKESKEWREQVEKLVNTLQTVGNKADKGLKEIQALRKEAPEIGKKIIGSTIQQGAGGIIAVVGTVGLLLSIWYEKEKYPMLGSFSAILFGTLLLKL